MKDALARERERQQALMAVLLVRGEGVSLQGWLRPGRVSAARGMVAYRTNAGGSAERSLGSAFPTVRALVGEEPFALLARHFWQEHPPLRGDLGEFGEGLAGFLQHNAQLADVPYLADCARLDWRVACAERAGDAQVDLQSLSLLAEADPSTLRFGLAPGMALLESRYPVAALWQAHQLGEAAAPSLAAARGMLARGEGEQALVWRQGWGVQVMALQMQAARWMQSLIGGGSLAEALACAGEGFDFEAWLLQAVQQGWVLSCAVNERAGERANRAASPSG